MSDSKIPITPDFQEANTVDVPIIDKVTGNIVQSQKIKKARRVARLSDLAEYERMGVKIVKFKTAVAAQLGKHAERLGVKLIGHGKLIVAAEHADSTIDELDSIIQEMMASGDCDKETLLGFFQTKLGFNKQLIEIGESHIDAVRDVGLDSKSSDIRVPFPQGSPLTVAITNQTPSKPEQVEPKKLAQ